MMWTLFFNVYGLIISAGLMVSNILYYFIRNDNTERDKPPVLLNTLKSIGFFGSMLFMMIVITPSPVSDMRQSVTFFMAAVVLVLYMWLWRAYFLKENKKIRLVLAFIPSLIFVGTGILTLNYPLSVCGIIFTISNMMIEKRQ